MQPTDSSGSSGPGRYVLESQLGVGGMGVVHVALDTHLQRRVALKVVSTQLAGSPEFRERFQREAATLARLDSPHIIAIYDHGEQDGLPFLATQLIRGGDLGDLVAARGPLPPASAVRVGAQVAEALSDAHAAGIVHRDIKPTNVLVRDPDAARLHVYLCDFGIAVDESTSDRLTTVGGVVGTWAYLAPERSHGEPATPASDIYALGCLLWVCLVGEAPYAGTDLRVVQAHVHAPVRQLVGEDAYVRHLNEVLARTMAKDPAHRYPDAASVRAALDAVPSAWGTPAALTPVPIDQGPPPTPTQVSGSSLRPTSPPPPSPPPASLLPTSPPPGRPPARPPARTTPQPGPPSYAGGPRRSRRGLLAVVAVVVVALVAGLAVWLTRGDDEPERASTGPSSSPSDDPTAPESEQGAGTAETAPTPDPPTVDPEPAQVLDASVVGDLDGDGLGDAVALFQDGTEGGAVRYTMTSTGSDFRVTPEGLPDFPTYGDLDGDGVVDSFGAVVQEGGALELTSSLDTVDGTVLRDVRIDRDIGFADVLVGDVDGNSENDLVVWGQSGDRTVTVWALLNEFGTLGDPAPWLVLEQAHTFATSLTLADYDNDGSEDLLAVLPTEQIDFQGALTSYSGQRGTRLYASNGIEFSPSGPLTEDSVLETTGLLVPGDYTGDGTPLVALSDPSGLGISIYDVTADGIDARPQLHVDLPRSSYVASARFVASDVDGDGDDDLVITRKIADRRYLDVQVAIAEGEYFAGLETWAPAPPRCADATVCSFVFAPQT